MTRNKLVFLLFFSACESVFAVDGVMEINQACAQAGCFTGDTAGFPVTINGTAGASYILTGNLDLSSAAPEISAIEIAASYITLDLNGFSIVGPNSCTGSGAGLNCTLDSTGSGVNILDPSYGVSVRNGTLRNMAGFGILGVGQGHRFTDLTVRHNGRDGIGTDGYGHVSAVIANENAEDGIDVDASSIVENCVASANKDDGVELDSNGALVRSTVARANGQRGFNVFNSNSKFGQNNVSTANGLADICGGGICTHLRRYYITLEKHDGASALSACASGFHMASFWELFQATDLTYDHVRGATSDDSGTGPPSETGGIESMVSWVRTGDESSDSFSEPAGGANCNSWTASGSGQWGSAVVLVNQWGDFGGDSNNRVSPWLGYEYTCDTSLRVWCIEN